MLAKNESEQVGSEERRIAMQLRTGRQATDEKTLIKRSLKGDKSALDMLFARYATALYPTALKLMGNPEDAEDALQDGLLSAFRNLRRFEGRSQFSTWLTRIVINAALMRLRSQRARPAVSLDAEVLEQEDLTLADRVRDHRPDPEEAYAHKEMGEIYLRNLQDLPPALRSAVELRDVQGLSTEEAAQALGVPEGTLKSQLHRARLQLAGLLKKALHRGRTKKNGSGTRLALCRAAS
jgi:RNA polymerase sigma-70 factor (ECF subfamily)